MLQAREDAASFVASNGRIRGAQLEAEGAEAGLAGPRCEIQAFGFGLVVDALDASAHGQSSRAMRGASSSVLSAVLLISGDTGV